MSWSRLNDLPTRHGDGRMRSVAVEIIARQPRLIGPTAPSFLLEVTRLFRYLESNHFGEEEGRGGGDFFKFPHILTLIPIRIHFVLLLSKIG